MNLNQLAKEVTLLEGGKVNLSIAQVKEVIRIVSYLMSQDASVVLAMLKRGEKTRKKRRARK